MKILLALVTTCLSATVYAYGTGLSTFPLAPEAKFVSAEFTGITSNGGGVGLQARFTQKINEKSGFDAGIGMAGGERSGRLFAGYDYELYPDYQTQPRVSLKAYYENSKEFVSRKNIFGIAPTLSKGFSFWGREAFPYLSLPLGLSLDNKTGTFNSTISANIGMSGVFHISMNGEEKLLTTSAEAIVGLKDSFTGVFLSFAYPIE